MTAETQRLEEARQRTKHWKRWGPYLSERAWGTVREDYSPYGSAWDYFPHDHARSRAYRWNEDGIAGISDRHQKICFAVALWNGRDPILKERLFGLTGNEGNHGEDVKEYYFYLDSTPTHSYMKYLYKYPQAEFPYGQLVAENRQRGKLEPEFELIDTGIFDNDRYFDVVMEYAKAGVEDILVKITATNRGPEEASLNLLPTIWFRNTWSWNQNGTAKPSSRTTHEGVIELNHADVGNHWLYCDGAPELLFTENDTNTQRLFNFTNGSRYFKDGINEYIVHGNRQAVNPEQTGTKATANYKLTIAPGETATIRLRLTDNNYDEALPQQPEIPLETVSTTCGSGWVRSCAATELLNTGVKAVHPLATAGGTDCLQPRILTVETKPYDERQRAFLDFDEIFNRRIHEADEFYQTVIPEHLSEDARLVMRQAFAGMLWSKQYYHYVIEQWLDGDPATPKPPSERVRGRNHEWKHLHNADVISMPDKWEYPWYAAWDLAFHCVPLALVDSEFAKSQLLLMLREWYMHPNGQLPAYEWAFGDVNPPVHAWAAWRVYKIEKKRRGVGDTVFLKRVFQKLLLNFTWWVNRKDADGMNIFQGGFLGLDNIGVFDRSAPLPTGGHIAQSDGTSWMAMYALNLLAIAMELAKEDPSYEDVASKFWEHFLYIAHAMNNRGDDEIRLWDEQDGFFYDVLHLPEGKPFPMKVRSMVGLIPLFAVETLEPELLDRLPDFKRRMEWFIQNRPDLTANVACMRTPGNAERRLLSIVSQDQLRSVLRLMLDENEFLSQYGIRAVSRFHKDNPYMLQVNCTQHRVDYEPAESSTGLFGGNSNWRGPIWFPLNYLLVESLQKFHHYLGEDFKVECPVGSGHMLTLWEVAGEISKRLSRIFLKDDDQRRPVFGAAEKFQTDPNWRDLIPFHEYFHGDNGSGAGASHQTGWTGLVAKLLQQSGE